MKKKLILLLVATCMLLTCFACGGKNNGSNNGPVGGGSGDKWEALPDKNFQQAEFRVNNKADYGAMEVVPADETSGNMIDIALMVRNAVVQDRYNIKMVLVTSSGSQIQEVLNDCIRNADNFDLAMTYVFESGSLITNGYVLNWNKLPYNHLDQSQWINGMNTQFQVRDAIYTTVSKMCVTTFYNMFTMFYNRDLGEMYDPDFSDTLFDTIRAGDWTYDYLMNFVNEYGYTEMDDVPGRTSGDGYALHLSMDWSTDVWHAVWDSPMIKNTVENGLEDVYMTDKLINICDRLHTMYYDTPGIQYGTQDMAYSSFMAYKSLFITGRLKQTFGGFDAFEGTYTIIPYPKYDENQETYRSGMGDNYSVMSIPLSADADFVSLIVEALSIASEDNLYPVYEQDALQGTTLSDPDSVEMLQYVLNGLSWDIGTLLNSQTHLMTVLRNDVHLHQGNSQIAQTYDGMKDDVAQALADVMEAFDLFQNNDM